MTSSKNTDPIDFILKSPLSDVLVKAMAHIYERQPQFPVHYLAEWLKNYSKGQKLSAQLQKSQETNKQKLLAFQQQAKKVIQDAQKKQSQLKHARSEALQEYQSKIDQTKFLVDLVENYIPNSIINQCSQQGIQLTGAYIGLLTNRNKRIEQHNFEPNAELDLQSPKIIQYVGASNSHQFMIRQILSNESGRSYEVLKDQEEPPAQQSQGKPVQQKKKYLYSPFVQKDQKLFFFRFPRLGSFACFPLKINSCLSTQAFDKGIGDYKTFIKNKQQIEKQYKQKYGEAKNLYEEAKRKYEQHQGNEEDASFKAEHEALFEQLKKQQSTFEQISSNVPVIEPFKAQVKLISYIFAVDTLGKDQQIPEQVLNYIEARINHFKSKWEEKQFKMLQQDILLFLQEESTLQNLDNYFKDQERIAVNSSQGQIREQFVNKDKQAEFQLSLIKVAKTIKILQETAFVNSMNTYIQYKVPKYKQIIQIILMILHYPKDQINIPRTNALNHRQFITKNQIQSALVQLQKYQLRRESSESVLPEYKINKLLERLQKIDSEAVSKYNSWLSALLSVAKSICWARIQCKNAKTEIYEDKLKAKNDRQAQISKHQEQMAKALQTAKSELNEQTTASFVEQEWINTYLTQNIKPQRLSVQDLAQFLDIQ